MGRYLEARRRSLKARPRLFNQFIEKLRETLGDQASIILFGGRATVGVDSDEPRDYDILVIVDNDRNVEQVEETVYKLKPKRLPVDVIIATKNQLKNPITSQMLKNRKTLHDPLDIEQLLREEQ